MEVSFDYVMAFEVLEHIKDDKAVLGEWASWLKPGGRLLLSVPAHQKCWNSSDVWAGHFRRYEKKQLLSLLESTGFSVNLLECYGFPVGNIIEPIRSHYHAKKHAQESIITDNYKQRMVQTERSGIHRSLEQRLYPLYARWFGIKLMQAAFKLQHIFVQRAWGKGYLLVATKL